MSFTCRRCEKQPPCAHWGERLETSGARTFYKIKGTWTSQALAAEQLAVEAAERWHFGPDRIYLSR